MCTSRTGRFTTGRSQSYSTSRIKASWSTHHMLTELFEWFECFDLGQKRFVDLEQRGWTPVQFNNSPILYLFIRIRRKHFQTKNPSTSTISKNIPTMLLGFFQKNVDSGLVGCLKIWFPWSLDQLLLLMAQLKTSNSNQQCREYLLSFCFTQFNFVKCIINNE